MNEWMHELMNERMNEWMNELFNVFIFGWKNTYTHVGSFESGIYLYKGESIIGGVKGKGGDSCPVAYNT